MKRRDISWGQIIGITIMGVFVAVAAWVISLAVASNEQQKAQQQHQTQQNEQFINQCVKAGKHVSSVNTGVYPNIQSYLVCQ